MLKKQKEKNKKIDLNVGSYIIIAIIFAIIGGLLFYKFGWDGVKLLLD